MGPPGLPMTTTEPLGLPGNHNATSGLPENYRIKREKKEYLSMVYGTSQEILRTTP